MNTNGRESVPIEPHQECGMKDHGIRVRGIRVHSCLFVLRIKGVAFPFERADTRFYGWVRFLEAQFHSGRTRLKRVRSAVRTGNRQ